MRQWKAREPAMASNRRGLQNSPMERIEESSERALRALSISIITKTERDRVEAFYLPHMK